jgi:tetratricopeptide (TPR) repeat protein
VPLSENDIVDVLNLRFVPIAYSVMDIQRSPGALRRIEGIEKVMSAPQILIAGPDGKLLFHTLMTGAPHLLRELRKALSKHPELNNRSAAEIAAQDPLDRLELALRAADRGRAEEILAGLGDNGPRARVLRARLARRLGKTEEALAGLEGLAGEDAAIERAYALIAAKRWEEAEAALSAAEPGKRAGEVRYLRGLVPYLRKDDDRAVEIWSRAVREAPMDPWSLRASWKMFALGMVGDSHVTESLR